jgi:hypothetical protein
MVEMPKMRVEARDRFDGEARVAAGEADIVLAKATA